MTVRSARNRCRFPPQYVDCVPVPSTLSFCPFYPPLLGHNVYPTLVV